MIEFANDWLMSTSILGEGAYGEVKLIINKHTDEKVACKIINYGKHSEAESTIKKEVMIHKVLNHENIIKYYGRRREAQKEYIYLEFAARGELFQLIEPDIGMPSSLAQDYMKQLLMGLRYLHSKGIVHRDIKPENLLINEEGVLKVSDFGMATVFRHKGRERLLDRRCGTKPYLAPEVMRTTYRGEPADIWSSGIVLLAMLAGELPWCDTLSAEFKKYQNDTYITETPWSKLDNCVLSLIRKILTVDPERRFTIDQILSHPWMKINFINHGLDITDGDGTSGQPAKRWNSVMDAELCVKRQKDNPHVTLSQPNLEISSATINELVNTLKMKPRDQVCFSQPTQNDHLIVGSPIQFGETPITRDNFHNLIKRLTRFYVTTSYQATLETFCSVLDSFHYTWNCDASGAITINTVDPMKNQLSFKANIIDMEGKILVDFRLSKGCGIEFKKKFLKLKQCLSNIVDKTD